MRFLNNFRTCDNIVLRGSDKNKLYVQYDLSFIAGHIYAEYNVKGSTPNCLSECDWNHMRF